MTARPGEFTPALGFHALTPLYDRVVGLTTRERTFRQALLRQAALEAGQAVLDVGCGTGTLAIAALQACPGLLMTGLNADPAVLNLARRKALKARMSVEFDMGRASSLPYADGQFDRVLSSLFFHHLSWGDKLLTARQIHRVLRPGGELHIADWGQARGVISRAAFLSIQLLDGFRTTGNNVAGLLPVLMATAGFRRVDETRRFATMFGVLSLYPGVKSA